MRYLKFFEEINDYVPYMHKNYKITSKLDYTKLCKNTVESVDKKFMNEFLYDFGIFITLNLSQVTKMGIDENATKELILMSQRLRQPLINGMNYAELTKDVNSIYKNPKMTSALVNQIRNLLTYIEPRIQKFVKECDFKQNWLSKIDRFKENYKIIIS